MSTINANGENLAPDHKSLETNKFESRFRINQIVDLDFSNPDFTRIMRGCKICNVTFTHYGKVLYDIEIPLFKRYPYDESITIITNVESNFVHPHAPLVTGSFSSPIDCTPTNEPPNNEGNK